MAERAAWMLSGEDEREDLVACRTWVAFRATDWACLTSGLMDCLLCVGGFDSCRVLNETSAARLRAKFVQSKRMEVRLGEAGLNRECWRRGSVEERRFSYCCWPSWFHRTFTLLLGTLGATIAGGGGL